MTIRRMLAVTHEASFTGAPIALAGFLEWIRDNTGVAVHTVVMAKGPMLRRFEAIGPVTVLDRSSIGATFALAERGLASLGSRRVAPALAAANLRPRLRGSGDVDLVYLNSFTTIEVMPHLRTDAAVVSHVHELPFALRSYPRPSMLDLLRSRPDAWIAVCGEVKTMLTDMVGVPEDRVVVHHPFIDAARIDDNPTPTGETVRLRKRLGIPREARVVVGSGTTDWRKGPELFVQLATEVRRRRSEPVHFVWVGGDSEGPNWERIHTDIERSHADHVHFVGSKADPIPWFSLADVFALTSHEDPFPLVCQEHALMEHPVVTYRNGGIVELLEAAGPEAATGVVPHLDVGAMADAVLRFLDSEELSRSAGRQLRGRVLAGHDRSDSAARLFEALEAIAEAHARTRDPR